MLGELAGVQGQTVKREAVACRCCLKLDKLLAVPCVEAGDASLVLHASDMQCMVRSFATWLLDAKGGA